MERERHTEREGGGEGERDGMKQRDGGWRGRGEDDIR